MTEKAKYENSSGQHARYTMDAGGATQWVNRSRLGQIRATKRSMVENRREIRRLRHTRGFTSSNSGTATEAHASVLSEEKSNDKPVPSDGVGRENCDLSGTSPSSAMSEHKRPRPEDTSTASVDINGRSTVPDCCLHNHISPLPSRDRTQKFACELPSLDQDCLQDLLAKESLYHPNNAFLYYVNPELEDKVDATLRNEAVHNLRFMHNTFFNLSTETFCKAVSLVDRFIVKVKVKPKYMACVATASYCAASKLTYHSKKVDVELPDPATLVHITRCGGNEADLMRMEEILASKLNHDLNGVNAYDFLQLFIDAIPLRGDGAVDSSLRKDSNQETTLLKPELNQDEVSLNRSRIQRHQLIKRMTTRMEIALCSLEVYRFRPACFALGILAQAKVNGLVPLANLCQVPWTDVVDCASLIEELYEIYYRDPLPCTRRQMVWNLSRRTLLRIGYSSPTPLDTISEDCEPAEEDEWLLPLLFEP
ncbi:unnamed protein product [Calicophoron daubneyi]|uniref:Cyclin N-terminal domain-containing protein n=1 Tax=Calicophoron daubneyi TaxID=300641 RepID=A0AAV2TQD7_CALDB